MPTSPWSWFFTGERNKCVRKIWKRVPDTTLFALNERGESVDSLMVSIPNLHVTFIGVGANRSPLRRRNKRIHRWVQKKKRESEKRGKERKTAKKRSGSSCDVNFAATPRLVTTELRRIICRKSQENSEDGLMNLDKPQSWFISVSFYYSMFVKFKARISRGSHSFHVRLP